MPSASGGDGIERTLVRAATDPSFRARLQAERSRAATEAGIALSESERAILDSAPADQLEAMIAALPSTERQRPEGVGIVRGHSAEDGPGIVRGHSSRRVAIALGAVAAGGAIGLAVCAKVLVRGCIADVPPAPIEAPASPAQDGAQPDAGLPVEVDGRAPGQGSGAE